MRADGALFLAGASSALMCFCSSGEDDSEVALTIFDEAVICDREACVDTAGNEVRGEQASAEAIVSRAGSRYSPGVYLYVGTFRVDSRYLELELDVPTARTGTTGVDARYREYLDGEPIFESESGSGEVRLILEDRAASPPAGRFDLAFTDGYGHVRRVVGAFYRPDVPPLSDEPLADQTYGEDAEGDVYVDYDPPPRDWDLYLDYGCGTDPEPAPETSSGGGGNGCEGDSGGDIEDGSSGGDGCEGGSSEGGSGGGSGCEGDSGGGGSSGGGCEGDA
ncbi:MAG: hypothetical protein HYY06_25865, partial [Deltaproteobacteria bacterium]|nr:hypothetical protein [Deltaproteobacteria bacterium]